MKLLREGVLALSLVATAPCHAQQSDRLIAEQAHRRLESLAPYGASGAVVITHDGAVIYRGGFGMADRATRRSMTPDLGVDIASMTKTLTAVAIARLIHQGVLNDTDGLKAWFPEAPADKAEITLGQLMLHRSGLPQFFIDGGDFQTLSRDEALSRIMSAELRFAPGTDEQYSDAGMTLLAILIERVTGQPFEDYLDTTLFRPMGLTDTSSYGTAATRARTDLAHGYLEGADRGTPAGYVSDDEWWALKGAGGVVSTADDIARWETRLRSEVGSDVWDMLMLRRSGDETDGRSYYGEVSVMPSGRAAYVRTGSQDFGFAAGTLRYDAEGIGVVVTINGQIEGMDVSPVMRGVLSDMDALLFGTPPTDAPQGVADVPAETGARLAGTYRFTDASTVTVSYRDGNLVLNPVGPLATEAVAFGVDAGDSGRLARNDRARSLVEKVCATTIAEEIPEEVRGYNRFIREQACTDGSPTFTVLGTIPQWYEPEPGVATLVEGGPGDPTKRFRMEWGQSETMRAMGGAAIQPPITLAARVPDGDYVAYHLRIQHPVRLTFDPAGRSITFHGRVAITAERTD